MRKPVTRIAHKGKQIIFFDGSGLNEEESVAAWEDAGRELQNEKRGTLILVNGTDVAMTPAAVNKAKEAAAALKSIPDHRVAFVGMTTLQKSTAQMVAKGFRMNVQFFKTLDEGKEWLVREDEKRR